MGFITTNTNKSPPFLFTIGDDNHDSAAYMSFIVGAVACGWLNKGDFVVVDNAILHSGGHADIASDFLWNAEGLDGEPLHITIIPFPTRAPELNPIEMSWNTFVLRLQMRRTAILNAGGGGQTLVTAAGDTLSSFTHEDNEKNYTKCGYHSIPN